MDRLVYCITTKCNNNKNRNKQLYLSSYNWYCAAPQEEIAWVVDVIETKHIKHVACLL